MTRRWNARALVLATLAFAAALGAQPSTDRLADVSESRARFGIDIGGTSGPLSPFQVVTATSGPVQQMLVMSYLVRTRDRFPIRAVATLYQSRELRVNDAGPGSEVRETTTDRIAAFGATVDLFDHELGGARLRTTRAVGTLGGGVTPHALRVYDCAGCGASGTPYRLRTSRAGLYLAASAGIRWKRFAIDQQVLYLLSPNGSANGFSSVAPVTMGVRF